jgi:lipopolysaccharide transport system permease protein
MLVMGAVGGRPEYEVVIERTHGWLRIDWRALWEYRDLFKMLVQRDCTTRYRQTLLGPLWFVLQPVFTTLVFAVVFGRVAGIPTDGLPAPLFYLCGLLGWNYFTQNLTTGGATFVNNAHLFGKVYFPRLIVPASVVTANLVAFALQLLPFAAFFVWFHFTGRLGTAALTWRVLFVPLPLLQIAVLSLGVGLCMSALTAKYRDLIHLTQYLIQIWMFATPIIYPISKVPAKWQCILWANPMSVPIEAFRLCLLGQGGFTTGAMALSVGLTLLLLFVGVAAFERVERTVIDSV